MAYRINEKCNGCGACVKFCPVSAISGNKSVVHKIDAITCIECGVCGKLCPTDAVLDSFGVVCSPIKRTAWQKPMLNVDACTSCGICVDACPVGCLLLSNDTNSIGKKRIPLMEGKKCIACGFCAEECPFEAITMTV
ncbi:MAG: 4Fe-4S binding protein [Deltaproteobacteria bacterium]